MSSHQMVHIHQITLKNNNSHIKLKTKIYALQKSKQTAGSQLDERVFIHSFSVCMGKNVKLSYMTWGTSDLKPASLLTDT
jgi:hypothetical protein